MKRIFLVLGVFLLAACHEQVRPASEKGMERIGISSDGQGFVLLPSGRAFHPWGNNYGNHGRLIEDYWATEWPTVERDFKEMKRMGANVVRVHLQFGKFMRSPTEPNRESLDRLRRLVRLAEQTGLYLDLTGVACYRRSDVPPWYDSLPEKERWQAQQRFWGEVAAQCANSPAIFFYDLINEPVIATEKQKAGQWYTGDFGGLNWLQYLDLDPAGRDYDTIAGQWIDAMKRAIREQDRTHFISAGWLPFDPGRRILNHFDFVCVHIYPEKGKVKEALATLRQFNIGKPVVIEETFPLTCSQDELRSFLLESRPYATGWIGHYNGEPRSQLEALKNSGKITDGQKSWLAWEELFRELGPVMAPADPGSRPN